MRGSNKYQQSVFSRFEKIITGFSFLSENAIYSVMKENNVLHKYVFGMIRPTALYMVINSPVFLQWNYHYRQHVSRQQGDFR